MGRHALTRPTASHSLPAAPRRVLVAGTSGAGKTTLAIRIAATVGLPRHELDALHHGPGWIPRMDFVADVERFAATDRWVTEWQYSAVRSLLAERADLVVWIDLPTPLLMRQIVGRTVFRSLTRRPLYNGNVEQPLWRIFTDRDHIIRWAWRTRAETASRIDTLAAQRPELPIVRVRSREEIDCWLDGPLSHTRRSERS